MKEALGEREYEFTSLVDYFDRPSCRDSSGQDGGGLKKYMER
jgi:hypothetical protein